MADAAAAEPPDSAPTALAAAQAHAAALELALTALQQRTAALEASLSAATLRASQARSKQLEAAARAEALAHEAEALRVENARLKVLLLSSQDPCGLALHHLGSACSSRSGTPASLVAPRSRAGTAEQPLLDGSPPPLGGGGGSPDSGRVAGAAAPAALGLRPSFRHNLAGNSHLHPSKAAPFLLEQPPQPQYRAIL
jgi:hypothetical protein